MKKAKRAFLIIVILFNIAAIVVSAKYTASSTCYTVNIDIPNIINSINEINEINNVNSINEINEWVYSYNYDITDYTFIVPVTGYYAIRLWGADGGDLADELSGEIIYGRDGNTVDGVVYLNEGDTLNISIGQRGQDGSNGGDTSISCNSTSELSSFDNLLVVAGGGCAYTTDYYIDGSILDTKEASSYAASNVLPIPGYYSYFNDVPVNYTTPSSPSGDGHGYAVITYFGSTYPDILS